MKRLNAERSACGRGCAQAAQFDRSQEFYEREGFEISGGHKLRFVL
jgi:hypothetical protein